MNKNYVFLADGFEEVEAITPVDVMRRAGLDVKTVAIGEKSEVIGAHGVKVIADLLFNEVDFADSNWMILPGGMPGAQNLYDYKPLTEQLKKHASKKGNIAAICASPAVVLGQLGLLKGKDATCYPGFENLLKGANHLNDSVVSRDNLITANGPATALKFSLAIIAAEIGIDEAENISSQMMNK